MLKRTWTPDSCDRMRATTVCTSSSTAAGSRAGSSAPARIFARSIRLPTTRFSRSVSSSTVVSSSRCCAASWTAASESRLVTDALIDASGVRRSCVTLENSAARSWLVSASSCAPRTRTSRRARSIARAACFAVASRSACSVVVNACAPGPRTARTIPSGVSPIVMGTISVGPGSSPALRERTGGSRSRGAPPRRARPGPRIWSGRTDRAGPARNRRGRAGAARRRAAWWPGSPGAARHALAVRCAPARPGPAPRGTPRRARPARARRPPPRLRLPPREM